MVKNKLNKFLILTWKKLTLITLAFMICFFFRNLFTNWFGIDASIPVYISEVLVIYLIVCLIYTKIKSKKLVVE